jgi:glycosyltransferase involved in cell wall biosynthesis
MVSPQGSVPTHAPRFHLYAAPRSLSRCLRGLMTWISERLPLQCLLSAPYDWPGAIAQARREMGPFDVTVVLLSRIHPWVKKSLDGRTVLDAVDSLRRNAEERGKAAGPATRWIWRSEERRMRRVESDAARRYGRIVVVSDEETSDFGPAAVAVTMGIASTPLADTPRAFDFGFWGRLPYFANADAARWLLDEIWPAIHALQPAATIILGGADAPPSLRKAAARRGVTLVSPIDNVGEFARNIRVALMPLRYGSGQSNKVLEAAEAGCAIVGTPQSMRGLAPLACHVRIESTVSGFASAAVDLLADDDQRAAMSAQLRHVVATQYARSATRDRLAAIAAAMEKA